MFYFCNMFIQSKLRYVYQTNILHCDLVISSGVYIYGGFLGFLSRPSSYLRTYSIFTVQKALIKLGMLWRLSDVVL